MKKLIFLFLIFGTIKSIAQTTKKIDSVYYLVDTAKTPVTDRMWDIYSEGPVTFYALQFPCTCPGLMNKPTFAYSKNWKTNRIISPNEFKSVKLTNLPILLQKIKDFAEVDAKTKNDLKTQFYIYLIEPSGYGYAVHKAILDGSGKKVTVQ